MSDNREGKSVLTLKNVTKRFSGLVAVNDLSLDMKERTIHALIGPNGAGKSTAINMITGLLPLTEGEIYHEGTKISGMSAHQIAQTRCSRTFQNLKLYRSMTVKENLMMGSMMDMKQGFFPFMFNFGAAAREEKLIHEKADSILEFIGLKDLANEYPANMPYGKQRGCVSAHGENSRGSKVHLAGKACDEIQAHHDDDVDKHLYHQVQMVVISYEHRENRCQSNRRQCNYHC